MYYTSGDLEFIQVLEDDHFVPHLDANKLIHKNGRWRLGKVKKEIRDNGWGGWGDGNREPETIFVPIEFKSEGS